MARPKLSVVVPIYNVESYISVCLDSLLAQTLDGIEIIAVDDGSTDYSGVIADQYAERYENITVIHRVNGGLGPARNTGIEHAHGEYVGFLDSDDWVEADMYENLYVSASKVAADMLYSGVRVVANGKTIDIVEHPLASSSLLDGEGLSKLRGAFFGALPSKELVDSIPVSACFGIMRLDFIRENALAFKNIRSEDRIFNIEATRLTSKIACASGHGYNYRKDDQISITNSFNPKTSESYYQMFSELINEAHREADSAINAILRTKRSVLDMARVLAGMIAKGSSGEGAVHNMRNLMSNEYIRWACEDFPFYKLPVKQLLFFFALKLHTPRIAIVMVNARNLLPLNGSGALRD